MYATFVHDGRISRLPRKAARRTILLDLVAMLFEPGQNYPESTVDEILRSVFDDHAALRRELVDHEFLARDHNVYWRSGGSVPT